jgi:ribosomal-protein-alanine N-acetyltransferase
MAPKDANSLFSRWPVMRALRNRIRRILPGFLRHRKLKMPVLETERLVMRKFEQDDLKDIIAWEKISSTENEQVEAQKFLEYCFGEYRAGGAGPWGMQLKETGAIAGNCGFPHLIFDELCGEVNYYIAPKHRGKELAAEAVKALLQFGFQEIGLTRIQARCDPDNIASERVMQKIGMKFDGFIEHAPFSKEKTTKQKLYAILAKDFILPPHGVHDGATDVTAQSDGRR